MKETATLLLASVIAWDLLVVLTALWHRASRPAAGHLLRAFACAILLSLILYR